MKKRAISVSIITLLLTMTINSTSIVVVHAAPVQPGTVMVGWGGDGIKYVQCGSSPLGADCSNDSASVVFPSESKAPKLEVLSKKLFDNGYNVIRVSFDPPGNQTSNCGSAPVIGQWGGETPLPSSPFGALNLTQLRRAVSIASYYYLWIIVDYHSKDGAET